MSGQCVCLVDKGLTPVSNLVRFLGCLVLVGLLLLSLVTYCLQLAHFLTLVAHLLPRFGPSLFAFALSFPGDELEGAPTHLTDN